MNESGAMTALPYTIEDARDGDGPALAALIEACFAEYPGCLFIPDEFPELARPAAHFAHKGGRLWLAHAADGALVGSLGVSRVPELDAVEITKVYAAPDARGSGLAATLLGRAFDFAREAGAREIMLWSDTRFSRAHRFYEKHGFARSPVIRFLSDASDSWEYHYRLALAA